MTFHEHSIEKCLISPKSDVRPEYKDVIIIGKINFFLNTLFTHAGMLLWKTNFFATKTS